MMRWILAVAFLLVSIPAMAADDTCTLTQDLTVTGGLPFTDASLSCAGGLGPATTLENDDAIDLDGFTLTIAAGSANDLVFADGVADNGCCVGPGTLELARSASDLSARLVNGDLGLGTSGGPGVAVISLGSILRFQAQDNFNDPGNGDTILNVATADVTVQDALFVPDQVTLCPDAASLACTSDRTVLRMTWRESSYGDDGSTNGWDHSAIDDMLRDVVAGRHEWCFLDEFSSYGSMPGEMNHCFPILAVNAPAPAVGNQDYWIEVNLAQGVEENIGNPIERREIIATTLAESVEPGERDIDLATTTFGADCTRGTGDAPVSADRCDPLPNATAAGRDFDWSMAWIRFAVDDDPTDGSVCTGACRPQPDRVYRIQRFDDGGAGVVDSVRLLDTRGVSLPLEDADGDAFDSWASGERVWIALAQGFETGDLGFLVDGGRIETAAASPSHDVNPMFLEMSGTSIGALLLDRIGEIEFLGSVCPTQWDYLIVHDAQTNKDTTPLDGNGDWLASVNNTANCQVGDLFIVGSDDGQTYANGTPGTPIDPVNADHGILYVGTAGDWSWRNVSIRYHGDDCLVSTTGDPNAEIDFLRCEWIADDADSASFSDWQVTGGSVTIHGGLCSHCNWSEGAQDDMFQFAPPTTVTAEDVFWAAGTGFWAASATFDLSGGTTIEVDNLDSGSPTVTDFFNFDLHGHRARDVRIHSSAASLTLANFTSGDVLNSYFSDVDYTNASNASAWFQTPADAIFRNNFYERFSKSGGGAFSNYIHLAAGSESIEDITVSEWPTGQTSVIQLSPSGTPTLESIAVRRSDPNTFLFDGAASTYEGVVMRGAACADRAQPADGLVMLNAIESHEPNFKILIGVEAGYADPAAGDFGTFDNSIAGLESCGAKTGRLSPGIHTRTKAHMIHQVEPECSDPPCAARGGGGAPTILPRALPSAIPGR